MPTASLTRSLGAVLALALAACASDPQESPGGSLAAGKADGENESYVLCASPAPRIDVAYKGNIELFLNVERPAGTADVMPPVKVAEEHGSFECGILSVVRGGFSYDADRDLELLTYAVTIDWTPGADVSGCKVEVMNPVTFEICPAELYMSY